MKKIIAFSLFAFALTGWSGNAAADWFDWFGGSDEVEEIFERTLDLAPGGSLSLDNVNGGLTVRSWGRQEVKIWAKKKAKASSESAAREILQGIEIAIDSSAGMIEIETRLPRKKLGGRQQASVKYELTVPREVALTLASTNGGIRVDGVEGEVDVETANGGIHMEDIGASVRAHTTNGGIKAYDIRGAVEARTTNGGIYVEMRTGSLSQDISFVTTNGSVELRMPSDLAARIEARTSNGRVSSDFSGPEEQPSRKRLAVDLNGGGPTIELKTSNGSIRLREI
jgi:DUF4097 and DUF4098 domain-containing protein YvlB